jgi:hypothetical protein
VKRGFLFGLHHLVEAYTLLLQPSFTRVVEDALIVAFCTHARNLLEFFFRRPDGYFAIARDYATTSYETLKYEDVKEEFERLCAQINHLTYERTDDDNKKKLALQCARNSSGSSTQKLFGWRSTYDQEH